MEFAGEMSEGAFWHHYGSHGQEMTEGQYWKQYGTHGREVSQEQPGERSR
jgi:hypothetical protein